MILFFHSHSGGHRHAEKWFPLVRSEFVFFWYVCFHVDSPKKGREIPKKEKQNKNISKRRSLSLSPNNLMTTAPAAPTKVEADIMSAFLTPAATIKAVENIGAVKANLPIIRMFMLGMLSGMYIAVGATVSLMVSRGLPSADPGLVKLVYGALFPVGLVLVVLAGAELITGNFAVFVFFSQIFFLLLLRPFFLFFFSPAL